MFMDLLVFPHKIINKYRIWHPTPNEIDFQGWIQIHLSVYSLQYASPQESELCLSPHPLSHGSKHQLCYIKLLMRSPGSGSWSPHTLNIIFYPMFSGSRDSKSVFFSVGNPDKLIKTSFVLKIVYFYSVIIAYFLSWRLLASASLLVCSPSHRRSRGLS